MSRDFKLVRASIKDDQTSRYSSSASNNSKPARAPTPSSESDFSDTTFGSPSDVSPFASRDMPSSSAPLRNSSAPNSVYLSSTSTALGQDMVVRHIDGSASEERVVREGYLLCLRSKGGIRHWKKYWAVLRANTLALYKDTEAMGQAKSAKVVLNIAPGICSIVGPRDFSTCRRHGPGSHVLE